MHFAPDDASAFCISPAAMFRAMSEAGERLRRAREARGYPTATAAAEALGIPTATYVQHENGLRGFPAKRAPQYARFFGVSPEWLLYGKGEAPPTRPSRDDRVRRTVPLVGYVGAGAVAHYYATGDGEMGEVDAPEGSTESTVAAEIRGVSLGPLFDRWLVFWDEVRTPVTPDLYGKLCVVGLPDDRILVKQIKPAGLENHFHLLSNAEEPMFDQEVIWAARVKSMTPR